MGKGQEFSEKRRSLVDSGIQPDRQLYFFFQIFSEILRKHYHEFTIKCLHQMKSFLS